MQLQHQSPSRAHDFHSIDTRQRYTGMNDFTNTGPQGPGDTNANGGPSVTATWVGGTQRAYSGSGAVAAAYANGNKPPADAKPLTGTRSGMSGVDPSELVPSDLVSIGGTETTLAAAKAAGLVLRGPDGLWYPVDAAYEAATNGEWADADERSQKNDDAMTEGETAELADTFDRAGGEAVRVAHDILQDGEAKESSIGALAARLQMEPAEAQARVGRMVEAYRNEAVKVTAQKTGASVDTVRAAFDWAADSGHPGARTAMQQHFNTGQPNYAEVVRDYTLHVARTDPQSLLSADLPAGFSLNRTEYGVLVLKHPGGMTQTLESAIYAGLIALG